MCASDRALKSAKRRNAAAQAGDFDMKAVSRAVWASAVACLIASVIAQSAPTLVADEAQYAPERPSIAPVGFVNFEMRYPDEVRDSAPAYATPSQIARARDVNDTVNGNITWEETRLWNFAPDGPAYGDCKTYALTKRHDLRLMGVPDGALRLVIVSSSSYEKLHMLLEIRSVSGVFVLDSLPAASGATFYPASAVPSSYAIIEYQAWGRPAHWVAPGMLTSSEQGDAAQGNFH